MPSDVDGRPSPFDKFASGAARFASKAWFFALCVALVVTWAPSYVLFDDPDTWQLVINTSTTIVTFLMVALLQNTQQRTDDAMHRKINAVALGLTVVLDDSYGAVARDSALQELKQAVGLEDREGS